MLVGIYLISPIMMDWWLDDRAAWYRPFGIWAFLIALYIWVNSRTKDNDDI
ncbi:MAG: hypothetical protein VW274_09610 [Thalassolituus sp.]